MKKNPLKHKYPRLYSIYRNMLARSRYKQHCKYLAHKDIKVFIEWEQSFMNFITWSLDNNYDETKSIDRIDNEKGYFPENCRWATRNTQNQNSVRKLGKSGFRGVKLNDGKFLARITINYKQITLGNFGTAIEAARAYDNYVLTMNLDHITNTKMGLI